MNRSSRKISLMLIGVGMCGCAATINESGLREKTAVAIGVSTSDITITGEDTTGAGTEKEWLAKTSDGKAYKCSIKKAAWVSSKAICTQVKK